MTASSDRSDHLSIAARLFHHLLLIICLSTISGMTSHAQPIILLEKSLGGSDYDIGEDIQQTADEGYILIGYSGSSDGDVGENQGNWDYWAVKLDKNANIEWQKNYGGSENDQGHSIQQTSDGGYIALGRSYSDDGDVVGYHGNSDIWIIRLDYLGNLQWQKSLGGSDYEFAGNILQTPDGGYIVAGTSASDDGDLSQNKGSSDCWVVKLYSNGTIQWENNYGGSSSDEGQSIQMTSDGGYILAGQTASNDGDVTGNHSGAFDIWVVKLDDEGSIQWQKCLGGTLHEGRATIQQTVEGGYIIGGRSDSNDGDVSVNHGNFDYWVVKLDSSGNMEWEKSYGGSGQDFINDIKQTSDNGFIITGASASDDVDVAENKGAQDNWVIKIDGIGNLLWQKSLGGSSADLGSGIQQVSENRYVVLGSTESTDGDVTDIYGSYDYWFNLLQIDNVTLTVNHDLIPLETSPNPFSNQFSITLPNEPQPEHITHFIYDVKGNEMNPSFTKTRNSVHFDGAHLPAGVYFIRLTSGDRVLGIGKVIKE